MVFNILKYQIPQIQYFLFKDYIARNLCVKKDIKNNCCQGKCFLEKQLKAVDESTTENSNNNLNTNFKKIQNNDIKEFLSSFFSTSKPVTSDLVRQAYWVASGIPGFVSVIFVPPKYYLKVNDYNK